MLLRCELEINDVKFWKSINTFSVNTQWWLMLQAWWNLVNRPLRFSIKMKWNLEKCFIQSAIWFVYNFRTNESQTVAHSSSGFSCKLQNLASKIHYKMEKEMSVLTCFCCCSLRINIQENSWNFVALSCTRKRPWCFPW